MHVVQTVSYECCGFECPISVQDNAKIVHVFHCDNAGLCYLQRMKLEGFHRYKKDQRECFVCRNGIIVKSA